MVKAVPLRTETEGLTREVPTKGWWTRLVKAESAMSLMEETEDRSIREVPRKGWWTAVGKEW
jgi:hypothetical protein